MTLSKPTSISGSVGRGGINRSEDVRAIQGLLNESLPKSIPPLRVDGRCGPRTIDAIRKAQQLLKNVSHSDGRVDPRGALLRALNTQTRLSSPEPTIKYKISSYDQELSDFFIPSSVVRRNLPSPSTADLISDAQYERMAKAIGCEAAAIEAVTMIEAAPNRPAFDVLNRPQILYERQIFRENTNHRFDVTAPDLSGPARGPGQYGSYDMQYKRLNAAMKLDYEAALKATSWGAFQILGENFRNAGYSSVSDFVRAMGDINKQADAFVKFILSNGMLRKALINKDWTAFARIYNGPRYYKYHYDRQIKDNYEKIITAMSISKYNQQKLCDYGFSQTIKRL
jgi:peptidoglycan hydrolase-like protein with peptidoglycan-binding domain